MTTALILVDVQRNMLEGDYPVPSADAVRPVLQTLLDRARDAGVPVVHVRNDGPPGEPDEPDTDGWHLVLATADGEAVVDKDTPDTFVSNPQLADDLRAAGVERVVIAGMQSEYCVAATSRGALGYGFAVTVASDGHATYDDGKPAAEISADVEAALRAEGVTVVPAGQVAFAA